jgi:hypothetical protein
LTDHSKVDNPVTLLMMKTIADRADKFSSQYSIDGVALAQDCRTTVRSRKSLEKILVIATRLIT